MGHKIAAPVRNLQQHYMFVFLCENVLVRLLNPSNLNLRLSNYWAKKPERSIWYGDIFCVVPFCYLFTYGHSMIASVCSAGVRVCFQQQQKRAAEFDECASAPLQVHQFEWITTNFFAMEKTHKIHTQRSNFVHSNSYKCVYV